MIVNISEDPILEINLLDKGRFQFLKLSSYKFSSVSKPYDIYCVCKCRACGIA